ncbi:MAG TPA: helix-turn-helix domain-containing protein [Gemmatimonadales bacterium]|nr:helix-turn-helix domain-containing protein [Gemmatimonadales bacterium]
MKDEISDAAARVLVRDGLRDWSVDRVARAAGCAKGLVHYHHGTKRALLQAVAARLESAHWQRRLDSLAGSQGADALDALWQALVAEVASGEWEAVLSLRSDPEFTPASTGDALALERFSASLAAALDLPRRASDEMRLVAAALDGLQLALHRGGDPIPLREAYHRLWLAVLP